MSDELHIILQSDKLLVPGNEISELVINPALSNYLLFTYCVILKFIFRSATNASSDNATACHLHNINPFPNDKFWTLPN